MKPLCATIQRKAIEQYFHEVLLYFNSLAIQKTTSIDRRAVLVASLTALMSMSVIPTLVVTTCVTPMAVLPSIP